MAKAAVDCRANAGFVIDPAGCTYLLPQSDTYPVVRGGITMGMVDAFTGTEYQQRDRDAGLDPRIAGTIWNGSSATHDVRVDAPVGAGAAAIELGCGDTGTQTLQFDCRDGGASLFSVGATVVLGGRKMDATGAVLTDANWPANEVAVNVTLGTAYALLRLAAGNVTIQSMLNHFAITQSAAVIEPTLDLAHRPDFQTFIHS